MDSGLKMRLEWWAIFLAHAPPRIVSLTEEASISPHSDAMVLGNMGEKWKYKGVSYVAHAHLPEWFLRVKYTTKERKIAYVGNAEFEITATILAATVVATYIPNLRIRVDLRIGNNTALRAIISRSAKSDVRAKLAQIRRRVNLTSGDVYWAAFVPSASHGADPPSRGGECKRCALGKLYGEITSMPHPLFYRILKPPFIDKRRNS